uniref:Uncharacterized protein n=1 Tax=Capitella teleta TaxID=283909 RepID=X2AMF9_CAPTE
MTFAQWWTITDTNSVIEYQSSSQGQTFAKNLNYISCISPTLKHDNVIPMSKPKKMDYKKMMSSHMPPKGCPFQLCYTFLHTYTKGAHYVAIKVGKKSRNLRPEECKVSHWGQRRSLSCPSDEAMNGRVREPVCQFHTIAMCTIPSVCNGTMRRNGNVESMYNINYCTHTGEHVSALRVGQLELMTITQKYSCQD